MMRSVLRYFWFLAFRLLVLMQWSAVVSTINQTSTLFKVCVTGQTPVAGMELLAELTVSSVFECGRLCWNNGDNAGCGGFLFQPESCDGSSDSPSQAAGCQLLEFSEVNLLSFEQANTSCPGQFYVSETAATAGEGATTTEPAKTTTPRPIATTRSSNGLFLTNILTGQNSVTATTQFKDELFVLRVNTSSIQSQVTVYNTTTFQPTRYSQVISGSCYGLAVEYTIDRLYLSDSGWRIHALDLNTLQELSGSPWSLPFHPNALSMNSVHNMLVPTPNGYVYVYNSSGAQVTKITSGNGTAVYQAVEVSNGTLVISAYAEKDVRLIAVDGTVLRSYGVGKVNNPRGLAVDKRGSVLVADYGNNRILALDPTLTNSTIVTFPLNTTDKIVGPMSLWYDESRGRLYVGEYDGQYRVLVFDNLLSISDILQP